jgi:hypothetical protein
MHILCNFPHRPSAGSILDRIALLPLARAKSSTELLSFSLSDSLEELSLSSSLLSALCKTLTRLHLSVGGVGNEGLALRFGVGGGESGGRLVVL